MAQHRFTWAKFKFSRKNMPHNGCLLSEHNALLGILNCGKCCWQICIPLILLQCWTLFETVKAVHFWPKFALSINKIWGCDSWCTCPFIHCNLISAIVLQFHFILANAKWHFNLCALPCFGCFFWRQFCTICFQKFWHTREMFALPQHWHGAGSLHWCIVTVTNALKDNQNLSVHETTKWARTLTGERYLLTVVHLKSDSPDILLTHSDEETKDIIAPRRARTYCFVLNNKYIILFSTKITRLGRGPSSLYSWAMAIILKNVSVLSFFIQMSLLIVNCWQLSTLKWAVNIPETSKTDVHAHSWTGEAGQSSRRNATRFVLHRTVDCVG